MRESWNRIDKQYDDHVFEFLLQDNYESSVKQVSTLILFIIFARELKVNAASSRK